MKLFAKKAHPYWENSLFLIAALVIFCGFFVMTVWGKDGLVELYNLSQAKNRVAQTNQNLLQDNLLVLGQIKKMKDKSYVEQRIKSELGLIREDEIVFVIPE